MPFGDPLWYQDWESPFYNDSHRRLRTAIRKYTDERITPFCHEWDENKEIPPENYREIAQAGWLACVVGGHYPEKWAKAAGLPLPAGVKPEEYDGGSPRGHATHFDKLTLRDLQRSTASSWVTSSAGRALPVSCGVSWVAVRDRSPSFRLSCSQGFAQSVSVSRPSCASHPKRCKSVSSPPA